VADLLSEKADVYADDQSGKFQAVDIPADVRRPRAPSATSSWRWSPRATRT
jgi:hypothetical protein